MDSDERHACRGNGGIKRRAIVVMVTAGLYFFGLFFFCAGYIAGPAQGWVLLHSSYTSREIHDHGIELVSRGRKSYFVFNDGTEVNPKWHRELLAGVCAGFPVLMISLAGLTFATTVALRRLAPSIYRYYANELSRS